MTARRVSGINRTNHEQDWRPLAALSRMSPWLQPNDLPCACRSGLPRPAARAIARRRGRNGLDGPLRRSRSAFRPSTLRSAADSAAARCTRSPPRARRTPPPRPALRWGSRRAAAFQLASAVAATNANRAAARSSLLRPLPLRERATPMRQHIRWVRGGGRPLTHPNTLTVWCCPLPQGERAQQLRLGSRPNSTPENRRRLDRRRSLAGRARRALWPRPRRHGSCARTADHGRGGASARRAVGDGGSAALPRHRPGDRRNPRPRDRSGGDAAAVARGRGRQHARSAAAPAPGEDTSAAATRWIVAAAPRAPSSHGVGPPRLAARLMRNRRGHLGTWIVEWNRTEQRYVSRRQISASGSPLSTDRIRRQWRDAEARFFEASAHAYAGQLPCGDDAARPLPP